MGLNIKNPRVHELARRAAEVTGKSQTGAIEEALERLLRDYGADPDTRRAQATIDVVAALVGQYAADPGRADRAIRTVDDLFDASTGLPR